MGQNKKKESTKNTHISIAQKEWETKGRSVVVVTFVSIQWYQKRWISSYGSGYCNCNTVYRVYKGTENQLFSIESVVWICREMCSFTHTHTATHTCSTDMAYDMHVVYCIYFSPFLRCSSVCVLCYFAQIDTVFFFLSLLFFGV